MIKITLKEVVRDSPLVRRYARDDGRCTACAKRLPNGYGDWCAWCGGTVHISGRSPPCNRSYPEEKGYLICTTCHEETVEP